MKMLLRHFRWLALTVICLREILKTKRLGRKGRQSGSFLAPFERWIVALCRGFFRLKPNSVEREGGFWDTEKLAGPVLKQSSRLIASALELEAERFLIFDDRQKKLAKTVGLKTS
jgi:hypothetical protein